MRNLNKVKDGTIMKRIVGFVLLLLLAGVMSAQAQMVSRIAAVVNDRIITTHNTLEKRLIGYVLTMREHLTADQKGRVFGLCRKSCSGAHSSQTTESTKPRCSSNP